MRVRDGYYARWQGREYEATPSTAGCRLYLDQRPVSGSFSELTPGRYGRVVPFAELEEFGYLVTAGTWKEQPVKVLAEFDDWIRIEYTGGSAQVAEQLGLDMFDRGVYQTWVPADELTDVHEERR